MKKELLAPAGDMETLKQAVHHGADAIYLGGKKFGARKFATNFEEEQIEEAIRYCHLYGVKVYVTVNTMIYEEEMEEVLSYVQFLYTHGVDAVIVQDLGLIRILREMLPDLPIHASTQMHTHNQEQLRILEELSVQRVVVAREMSLDEIQQLDTSMELECFIHGALCVSYSGQCLFSSMLFSRSGNRGACAGVCRLPFQLMEDGKPVPTEGEYLLSMRELNTMRHIDALMESKIDSFKIEGRMKSPVTIGFIVSLYRKLIDGYESGQPYTITEEDQKHLMGLFHREFTDGYLFHSSFPHLMNIHSPNHIGYPIGKVVSVTSSQVEILLTDTLSQGDGIRFLHSQSGMIVNYLYHSSQKLISSSPSHTHVFVERKGPVLVGEPVMKTFDFSFVSAFSKYEEKKIPITMKAVASSGSFQLEVSDSLHTVTKKGDFVSLAEKAPTSKERVEQQLSKTGNTPFVVTSIDLVMEDSLFLPIASLNALRRDALLELQNLREESSRPMTFQEKPSFSSYPLAEKLTYSALVRTEEQLQACVSLGIDYLYTPNFSLYQKYKNTLPIFYRLGRVKAHHPPMENERLLIGETGSLCYTSSNEVFSDYYLNVANRSMVDFLFERGVQKVTLSIECQPSQVFSLLSSYLKKPNVEVILYGWIEAMVMKYCPLSYLVPRKEKGSCATCRNGKNYTLKDRNGAVYPLVQEKELTHVFFYQPIEREVSTYFSMGIRSFRFEFLNETEEEVRTIIKKLRKEL